MKEQFPTGHGVHVRPSEIAVTQWAYPHTIKSADYLPPIANWEAIRDVDDFHDYLPDGRIAAVPEQSSLEKGRQLVMLAAQDLVKEVQAFSHESSWAGSLGCDSYNT